MIPLLVKKALIAFQNDLLPFLLLLFENTLCFSIFGHVVAFVFFIFISKEVFPRRLLEL